MFNHAARYSVDRPVLFEHGGPPKTLDVPSLRFGVATIYNSADLPSIPQAFCRLPAIGPRKTPNNGEAIQSLAPK
jgi:hypothetical protein